VSTLRVVTTSWDDGDPRDLKIADLLSASGLSGTFYVPIMGYRGKNTLKAVELRSLSSATLEVGAHTVSHRSLPKLSPAEMIHEVRACKEVLEQTLGCGVHMFCYPNGRHNAEVIRQLRCAGYKGARTTEMLSVDTHFCPYQIPTSLQAYPHPKAAYIRNLGRAMNIPAMFHYVTKLSRSKTWVELGERLFARVLERGGVWHLYGHSWEIDELGMWKDLREILDHVSCRKNVSYLTNSQLVAVAKGQIT
jgi:peptidoglycan-N-acetylglucosamine deacetylase